MTYALGVVRSTETGGLPGAAAPLGPVRAVVVDDLAVVVADVDDDVVAVLRGEDLAVDDVAPLAVAHDAVLCSLAATRTIVPLRIGTILVGDDAVRRLVSATPRLRTVLDRVAGHQEWTVEVSRPHAGVVARPDPGGAGRDYLRASRDRLRDREERRRRATDAVATAVERLEQVATSVTRIRPSDGGTGPERLACLVRAEHAERLGAVAAALADETGVHVDVRGPYPPYHFVEDAT